MKHFIILIFASSLTVCAPKIENRKEDTGLIALLRKREQGVNFRVFEKKELEFATRTKRTLTQFDKIFNNKTANTHTRVQQLKTLLKKKPFCIYDLLFVLEDRQDAFEYKRMLFHALTENKGALKYQDLLAVLMRSENFDVNYLDETTVLGNDSSATIKKTLLHRAVENLDLPLMQLLCGSADIDLTRQSSCGLMPLDAYNHYVRSMAYLRRPVDPVMHQEITNLLTPAP